jgi:hypothetical protein
LLYTGGDRDGHLTMTGRIGEIHDWLLQHL